MGLQAFYLNVFSGEFQKNLATLALKICVEDRIREGNINIAPLQITTQLKTSRWPPFSCRLKLAFVQLLPRFGEASLCQCGIDAILSFPNPTQKWLRPAVRAITRLFLEREV